MTQKNGYTYVTPERARTIMKANLSVLDQLEGKDWQEYQEKYPDLFWYLTNKKFGGGLIKTLRDLYAYLLSRKQIITYNRMYLFVMGNDNISANIRHNASTGTASRHINLLCCLGLIRKVPAGVARQLKANKDRDQRLINVYKFNVYNDQNLKAIEERASKLRKAEVTSGTNHFTYCYLCINGCTDIAREVFVNDPQSVNRKWEQYGRLKSVMDQLIYEQGYCNKSQILQRMDGITERELDLLLSDFDIRLRKRYIYKIPDKKQRDRFNLGDSRKKIYLRKEV